MICNHEWKPCILQGKEKIFCYQCGEEKNPNHIVEAKKEIRGTESFITASFEGLLNNYKLDLCNYLTQALEQDYSNPPHGYKESACELTNDVIARCIDTIQRILK